MALDEYRRKRDFRGTREPKGRKAAGRARRIFVVQHHLASSEHDDFRLELDGVLKSWAVPKLVSDEPGVRRLAIEVEDHPLEYANFEGTIPEGHYGAGTVEIRDSGTWRPEGDPAEGLAAGKLSFELRGRELKGRWTLIRTSMGKGRGKKRSWLLVKRADDDGEH